MSCVRSPSDVTNAHISPVIYYHQARLWGEG